MGNDINDLESINARVQHEIDGLKCELKQLKKLRKKIRKAVNREVARLTATPTKRGA